MAGARVEITVNDAEVRAAFRQLRKNADRQRAAFDEIGAMLVASTQQRFEEERDPDGVPWPPLAASTQRKKTSKRGPRRGSDHILRVRGHLYASITHLATDEDVLVGTNRRYAALHQFGGRPGMRNPGAAAVPARPFLGISEDDRDEILRILADHLMEGL